jgi:hypothetical protein
VFVALLLVGLEMGVVKFDFVGVATGDALGVGATGNDGEIGAFVALLPVGLVMGVVAFDFVGDAIGDALGVGATGNDGEIGAAFASSSQMRKRRNRGSRHKMLKSKA